MNRTAVQINVPSDDVYEETLDCLIVDDDGGAELEPIISVVEGYGLTARHSQGLEDLAAVLVEYELHMRRPTVILIDVQLPDYPNFGVLNHPEILVDSADTAGVTLYEKILADLPVLKGVPLIFISSHNNIAIFNAHRLRVQNGIDCMFASKSEFAERADSFLKRLVSPGNDPKEKPFTPRDYEALWAGVCDFYSFSDKEASASLGVASDSKLDFLTCISNLKDVRARIDALVDIGVLLQILFDDEVKRADILNAPGAIIEARTARQIIVEGSFDEVTQLKLTLEYLAGAK